MNEDEAREKWCPFARVAVLTTGASTIGPHNRVSLASDPDVSGILCIASDCAAWRWKMTRMQAAQQRAISNSGAEESGYCGLAGKP